MRRKAIKHIIKAPSKKSSSSKASHQKRARCCGTMSRVSKRVKSRTTRKTPSSKPKKSTDYLYDDDPFLLESGEKKK
jgi:hypothetical protein